MNSPYPQWFSRFPTTTYFHVFVTIILLSLVYPLHHDQKFMLLVTLIDYWKESYRNFQAQMYLHSKQHTLGQNNIHQCG
jgi:hypothetical protein